jgi:hypothetical protein
MKLIYYLCGAVVAATLAVVVWKWSSERGSGLAASGGEKGVATERSSTSKAAEQKSVRQGEWATARQPDGTSFRFIVKEFGAYKTDFFGDKLAGRAAILIEFAPVSDHISFGVTKTSAEAQLQDGSTAGLRAFRPFNMDSDAFSMHTSALSTNRASQEEMIEGTSRIGGFSSERYLTFGLSENLLFSFKGSGTNSMTLGLIFEAPFANVKTVTVFGMSLKSTREP